MSEYFLYGFSDELEKIGWDIDWSIAAPALAGAGIGGVGGYYGAKGLGAGKKGRIAGAALGAAGGGALGAGGSLIAQPGKAGELLGKVTRVGTKAPVVGGGAAAGATEATLKGGAKFGKGFWGGLTGTKSTQAARGLKGAITKAPGVTVGVGTGGGGGIASKALAAAKKAAPPAYGGKILPQGEAAIREAMGLGGISR